MASYFCLSVRFLQPYSHGRGENGEPEWPPSPLRVFQALAAGAAGRWNERERLDHALSALRWLEAQPSPQIVAASGVPSSVRCLFYVPDNTADRLVPAWKKGDLSKQVSRTEKVIWPMNLEGDAVFYLYSLSDERCGHLEVLTAAARSMTHLGWGIDVVVGDASIVSQEQATALDGDRWRPNSSGSRRLRIPVIGTVDDLVRKHDAFLNRLVEDTFRPVSPLKTFGLSGYRLDGESQQRPFRTFELRSIDGTRFRYPPRKLMHIAGMVRHLAIRAMERQPPRDAPQDWVRSYVAGHANRNQTEHRQLSYLPLPSIGNPHTDPGVRRVMISAPVGDDAWLNHVARRLAGRVLEPLRGDEFGESDPPLLMPVAGDNMARLYTRAANAWATVTPVILPGHDDHKPEKTRKLIETTLAQAGVEQPCEYEWSAFSRFPKSLPAHKYDKSKRLTGYLRPDYLNSQTAVHLTLRFKDDVRIPGPLTIGAGRHCGLGLLAPIDD